MESVNQGLIISITQRSLVMTRTGTCHCGRWSSHCSRRCDPVILCCRVCREYSWISVAGLSGGPELRDSGPHIPTPRFRPSSLIDVHEKGTWADPFHGKVREQGIPFREHLFRYIRMVWIGNIATQTPRVHGKSVAKKWTKFKPVAIARCDHAPSVPLPNFRFRLVSPRRSQQLANGDSW